MFEIINGIYSWVYAWQTLVGALIALVAALRTIRVMRAQSNSETRRHEESLKRKRLAARVQMPDALSEMTAYARGCAAHLMGLANDSPSAPASAIATLKEVVEFIDMGAAERTFQLVSWCQVLRARIEQDVPLHRAARLAERQYEIVLMQAYVNGLFDYARNEADEVETLKPSREQMNEALTNAFSLTQVIEHEEDYVELRHIIERRHSSRG